MIGLDQWFSNILHQATPQKKRPSKYHDNDQHSLLQEQSKYLTQLNSKLNYITCKNVVICDHLVKIYEQISHFTGNKSQYYEQKLLWKKKKSQSNGSIKMSST